MGSCFYYLASFYHDELVGVLYRTEPVRDDNYRFPFIKFHQVLYNSPFVIGSTDLQKYNLKWWRKHCGVVMQDGVIFSESIARNIAVDDGEIDKERLLQAARIACIDNYIQTLPLKYNTLIGQDGIGLSRCATITTVFPL